MTKITLFAVRTRLADAATLRDAPIVIAGLNPENRCEGEAVYLFAFDIAYELRGPFPARLHGEELEDFQMDASRRRPRGFVFSQTKLLRLPPQERMGPHGAVHVETTVKIHSVGALSIAIRVPFALDELAELGSYHDLAFADGLLAEEARAVAESVTHELRPWAVRPKETVRSDEAYTVFCLRPPPVVGFNALRWLAEHRETVAAVLTQELPGRLAEQEMLESTSRALSYYVGDLAVIDWDAALLITDAADAREMLHALELANLQLAELEAYDALLDAVIDRSYRDIGAYRRRGAVLRELRELQIDLTRFHDELANITKFFGDWHLARIYEGVAARFHIDSWHRSVDGKLRTLGEMHQLLKDERSTRWMMILEVTIVVLLVVEILFALLGWKA